MKYKSLLVATSIALFCIDTAYSQNHVAHTSAAAMPALANLQPTQGNANPLAAPAPESDAPAAPQESQAPALSADDVLNDSQAMCMAKIVYHEAGNQSIRGKMAVAQVVLNRLHSPRFPKKICDVAMQHGQFFNVLAYSPPHNKNWNEALDVTAQMLTQEKSTDSESVVGDALYFWATHNQGKIPHGHEFVAQIGAHMFFR
jgi:N-acetylmuramoyl-L-alanine amidase